MKKLPYIIFLTAIIFTCMSSCDLDTTPTKDVPEEVVFVSVENAEQILNGTWAYLMDNEDFTVRNPGWVAVSLTSDAMGNDIAVNPNKYGYNFHYQFNYMNQSTSSTVQAIWTLAYKSIDNYNHIISKIDDLPSTTDNTGDLRKRIKAQALVMRGYLYLNLATFYAFSYQKDPDALCVPIYTQPSTGLTPSNPRSPLKDVYNRAITDLKDGYDLFESMKNSYRRNGKYKVDKNVAAGILARAYLQMGDGYWNLAADYASKAQENSQWMSKNDYTKGFNSISNAEWIWGHGQTSEQKIASYSFCYLDVVSDTYCSYHSFLADPYFKDLFIKEISISNDTIYDTDDVRYSLFEWETREDRLAGSLLYKKFLFNAEDTPSIVMMRKAEMVLIEAESLAEQNLLRAAIDKLNDLRETRGASTPDLSNLTKDELVEEILIERRKELFGEGFSLSDILRRQKAVERKAVPLGTTVIVNGIQYRVQGHTIIRLPNEESFTPNSPYYIFSAPIEEITNNPNWQQ